MVWMKKAKPFCKYSENEQSRKLIGKDFVSKTVQRYETTTRYLEEFIKKEYQLSDIALNNLEANFISKFDALPNNRHTS